MSSAKFERLLEPGQIGKMTLKNRMKSASATTLFCTEDGRLTDREINCLAERARGGAALVTSGAGHATSWGRIVPHMMVAHDDSVIPGLTRLARAIHEGGAKACFQVIHCGRYAYAPGESTGPSAIQPNIPRFQTPRELTTGEVEDLVKAQADAARRGWEAGFDCVEVCANAGYLIASFLCPVTNKRTDKYGGSLENRARFLVEIIDAVRGKVEADCPIICRICGDELTEGGNTPEDMQRIAQMAQEAGMDAISVSVGWHDSRIPSITHDVATGGWLYLAEGMKKALRVPVLMAYRLNSPEVAERAIAEGKLDFWEMARPLFADPELPRKVAEGRPEDIAPCIGCCQYCFDKLFTVPPQPVGCIINPRMGHEGEEQYQIRPAPLRKKVVVVGSGPGGMEAARVAALRGHRVSLYEKKETLGGHLPAASALAVKSDIRWLNTYLATQMEKLGVEVHLNTEATAQTVAEERPDAVILAAGGTHIVPDIPGVTADNVALAADVLTGRKDVGDNVVVVGGGLVGCEAAEFLAAKGKKVTVLEMLDRIANDIGTTTRWTAVSRLRKAGVRIETKAKAEAITDKGVKATREGTPLFFEGGSVVLAVGLKAEKTLAQELEGRVADLHVIGDCVEPRRIGEAMSEGFLAANKI
jgi:2,4-dienoyl-CoA reductase (NADPH2)